MIYRNNINKNSNYNKIKNIYIYFLIKQFLIFNIHFNSQIYYIFIYLFICLLIIY